MGKVYIYKGGNDQEVGCKAKKYKSASSIYTIFILQYYHN